MENQKTRSDSENDRKRQMITEDMENVKRKHVEFQFCITMLNKDIENCCKEGEEKNEILYFLKANWLRKTIREKENLVRSLVRFKLNLALSSFFSLCLSEVDISLQGSVS